MRDPAQSQLPDGVFAAALTPQRPDLSVDHGLLADHCRSLLESGCDGIAPLGTTGEAASFSVPERIAILDGLMEAGIPPERILVGTGCCALPETVVLTRHAAGRGVGGVLLLPPFFYKGVREEGLLAWVEEVVRRVGEPAPRIWLYHFPRMTGVPWAPEVVRRLVERHPRTIVGMKDSSGDLEAMRATLRSIPGFRLFSGTEELLLDVVEAGGAGCISATANVTGGLAAAVLRARGTPGARGLQDGLTAVRRAFERHPFVPGLKRWLSQSRLDSRWSSLRPPLAPLDDASFDDLRSALEAAGFSPKEPAAG